MRQAWLVLLVLLAACGGVGYNATGLWEGAATNPNGGISVRFNLKDENGNLSGSHSVYLYGAWQYVGSVRGSRSGQEASLRVDAYDGSGYIQVNGRFEGDRFSGTYLVVAYGSGSTTANLSLRRGQTSPGTLAIPSEPGQVLQKLWESLK